jgi:hypothetical protein
MYKPSADEFIFIVDTSEYAGNYERNVVAFMTGQVGECSVGFESSEFFWDESDDGEKLFVERAVIQKPDEHGTFRPASIWPTPNRTRFTAEGKEYPAYDSVAVFLSEAPPEEYLNRWHDRAVRFGKNPQEFGCHKFVPAFEVQGSRLVKQVVSYEGVWLRMFMKKEG